MGPTQHLVSLISARALGIPFHRRLSNLHPSIGEFLGVSESYPTPHIPNALDSFRLESHPIILVWVQPNTPHLYASLILVFEPEFTIISSISFELIILNKMVNIHEAYKDLRPIPAEAFSTKSFFKPLVKGYAILYEDRTSITEMTLWLISSFI